VCMQQKGRNATREADNFCFNKITFSTQLMVKFIYKNYNWFHNQILDFYCYITNTVVKTYTNKPSLDGCRGRTLEWASSLLEENLWPFFFFWLAGQDGQSSDGDAVVIIKSFRGPCKIKGTAENLNIMYVKWAPLPPFLILLPGKLTRIPTLIIIIKNLYHRSSFWMDSLSGCGGRTLEWANSFRLAGQDGQNSDGDAVAVVVVVWKKLFYKKYF